MNTSSITERDKKLLYGLGIIVIVALFYLIGIRPLNQKINKLENKIDAAQVEHDSIKMKIFQLETLKEFESDALAMNNELSARYYNVMVPAEIDRMLTGKALGYGLKVNNLLIQKATDNVQLLPYTHSDEWTKYQQSIADGTSEESASDSSLEDEVEVNLDAMAALNNEYGMYYVSNTSYSDVYATKVTLDVYGNHDKAQELLDELINDKAMRITYYEWGTLSSLPVQYVNGELVTFEVDNPGRLVINIEFYMYDGTEFNAMMEEKMSDDAGENSEEADDSVEE